MPRSNEDPRKIEDKLREEYSNLLYDLRCAVETIETKVRYSLLPLTSKRGGMGEAWQHERIIVSSRVKECESAIEKLRRHQEGRLDAASWRIPQ